MLPRSTLLRALTRPQVIVAALLLVSVLLLLPAGRTGREERPFAVPEVAPAQTEPGTVQLVTYDRFNLESVNDVQLELPLAPARRLEAALAELKAELIEQQLWPGDLPLPVVFLETLNRQRVAVLDFRPPAGLTLPVATELRLLQSIEATVLANGADTVRFLLAGRSNGVFLLNVAVPAAL